MHSFIQLHVLRVKTSLFGTHEPTPGKGCKLVNSILNEKLLVYIVNLKVKSDELLEIFDQSNLRMSKEDVQNCFVRVQFVEVPLPQIVSVSWRLSFNICELRSTSWELRILKVQILRTFSSTLPFLNLFNVMELGLMNQLREPTQ